MSEYQDFVKQVDGFVKDIEIGKGNRSYNKEIKVDSEQVNAYYNLALKQHNNGDLDGAINNFKKAAEVNPKDASIFNNLGVLYYSKELLEEAKASFRKAIELEPNYPEGLYGLGNVYLKQERIYDAIVVFQKCLNIEYPIKKAKEKLEECYEKRNSEGVHQKYKSILIVMDEGIGNMIMLTPAIKALKMQMPGSKITILGKQPSVQVLDGWDIVEKVLTEPDGEQYDIGFLSVWFGNYEWQYGKRIYAQCETVYKVELDNVDMHETEHYLKIARFFGYKDEIPESFCMIKEANIELPPDKKIVALSNTTLDNVAWEKKRWPYYHALAHELIRRNYTVLLIGGKGEAEKFGKVDWPTGVINCLGKCDIQETAGLLKKCDIFIGNDSGPAHLSAALGVSTYVLFGPTRIIKNQPRGSRVKVITKNMLCSPCQYTKRWDECNDWQCMSQITVEDVLQAIGEEPLRQQEKKVTTQVPAESYQGSKKILIMGVLDVASSTNVFMKKGFERQGFQVDAYNYRTRILDLGNPQAMWDDFRRFLNGKRYEFIVFCKVNGLDPELITYAGQYGKTWYWFMDHLGVAREIHADEYVKRADFASATSEEVCNWFLELNPKTFHLIEGFDPETYFHEGIPKVYDVLFIGNATEKRINDLRLLRNGQTVTIFGSGWPQDFCARPPIYNEELRKAICESKIVLNLVHSNIFSDRVVLTAASGGFILSQACPDLERHFQRKVHLDWFRNAEEAQQLIHYYLEHHEEREKIAKNGMHYVRQKYNWESVCREVLQKVETILPRGIAASNRKTAERVLFVSWHGLGDNVMLTPALRKYKQLNPSCYIGVAGLERFGETLVQLLSGLSFVDEVIPCLPDAWNDFPDYKTGVDAIVQRAQAVGKEKGFSKVVVLPTNRQEGYKLHKVFRFADEVGVQFDNLEDLQTELAVTKEAEKLVEKYIKDYSKPMLVLHAKAGNQPKTLAAEDIERIIDQYRGYTVFEFGRRSTSRSILVSEDNMEFSKALIKRADMVIAIDSVVMHIAGAFRRPLIAIFTITPAHQAVPLTYRVDVCGANNDMTQLDLWPGLRKKVEEKYPREKNYGFDQRWYYEGGSSCYMGYWWGERGGMGLRITERMNKIIDEHPEMFENCKVIDVGCAAGYYVKVMRDRGIEAYGCDPSEWIINREESLMTQYKKYLKVGFAHRIPFSGNYETVLLLDVLEHLSDIEYSNFLSEIKRLNVKALIIKVPTEDRPDAFNDPTHVLIKSKDWWFKEFRNLNFNFVGELDDSGSSIWFFQRTEQKDSFAYSQNYYENYYRNWTKSKSWDTFDKAIQNVMQYKSRYASIFRILSSRLNNAGRALFCGVHQGKDCFWFQEIMQDWEIFGFDFSRTVLEWCKINYPKQAQFFLADAEQICLDQQTFDVYFDLVVCIDFTEHLPYQKALRFAKETFRVAKPGSLLLAQQGTSPLPEHINILKEQDFIKLFSGNGWNYFQKMPFDHYLFTKEANS